MATTAQESPMHHIEPGAGRVTCGIPRANLSTATSWAPVTCDDCNHLAAGVIPPARATVAEAIAAWETKGSTSLTVALMADALYGIREAVEGRQSSATG